jgi:hypothetical protein
MTGHKKVRAHTLRADVARLEKNDERWSIWLAPEATVVELALLLGGIPCKLEAHNMGEGAFALIPVEAHAPCPTAAQIAALFEKGLGRPLPSLRQVEDDRLDITDLGSATQRFNSTYDANARRRGQYEK